MIVELIYLASPEQAFHRKLDLPEGATIEDAILESKLLDEYSELSLSTISTGIFASSKPLSTTLSDGDRVEVYRPLTISPMEKRRLLAKNKDRK